MPVFSLWLLMVQWASGRSKVSVAASAAPTSTARGRARGQDRGGRSASEWGLGDPAELFEQLESDVDAGMRLLHADDAVAEPLLALLGAENAGVPVALIEPLRNGLVQHGEDTYDIRIAIATKMGLPLTGPIGPRLAAGWTFGPHQGKWDLTPLGAT